MTRCSNSSWTNSYGSVVGTDAHHQPKRPGRVNSITAGPVGPGNGRLGVVGVDAPSAALLVCRLRARGHHMTQLVVEHRGSQLVVSPLADASAVWRSGRGWTYGASPASTSVAASLHAIIPTGGRRAWAMIPAEDRTPVLVASASIDLSDELAALLWLADHDIEVPRVLGRSAAPEDLLTALPTNGPVLVARTSGDTAWARRSCRDRRDLEATIRMAAEVDGTGDFYLLEDVGGRDAVVAGVFRDGQPVAWGARAVERDHHGRLIGQGPVEAGRLFEIAEEAAERLQLNGPAELEFRSSGGEAHLIGVVPVVTWTLLSLGGAVDEALTSSLVRLGVPCTDRPPADPTTAPPRGWQCVAPQRAWSTASGIRRVIRSLSDPFRLPPGTPRGYQRWALNAGLTRSFGSAAANERSGDDPTGQ